MGKCEALQPNWKLDIARRHHILDLEVLQHDVAQCLATCLRRMSLVQKVPAIMPVALHLEAGLKAKLLDDPSILQ